MTQEGAHKRAFLDAMAALRARPGRPQLSEVARLALDAGLDLADASLAVADYEFGERRGSETAAALNELVAKLCEGRRDARIMAYMATARLLTGGVAEGSREITYVCPHDYVAETVKVLLRGQAATPAGSVADLPKDAAFDVIVCQPHIGYGAPGNSADIFGAGIVCELVPFLADRGTLYWITARGAVLGLQAKKTQAALRDGGLNAVAVIDVAPGAFPGTMIEGAVLAFRRERPAKRFVGVLRDSESAAPMAAALLAGPSKKSGSNWTWLSTEDGRTYKDLEQARLLETLKPRGRHKPLPLSALLVSDRVEKADRPLDHSDQGAAFLFVPEYAGSRATADLDEQTVQAKAVYRLAIDPAKANPRFLARLLNSPYGKQLRASAAHGATIPRTSVAKLLSLEFPIPDPSTQDRLARIDADVGLLQAAFQEMQEALDRDWTAATTVTDKLDGLKAVLDIERRIADWWRELPYPLATIYRRYRVLSDPKERLEALLHFFEMAAVYLAAIGTSHVKALRADWQEIIATWLHPTKAAGIERADFGFWIGLAGASLKDASRIASDKKLREIAIEIAGPGLVQVASTIGPLGRASEVLDVARRYRNTWKGHGGYMKPSDAARLDTELQQSVRDFYRDRSFRVPAFPSCEAGKARRDRHRHEV